jgi:hypothetical protein
MDGGSPALVHARAITRERHCTVAERKEHFKRFCAAQNAFFQINHVIRMMFHDAEINSPTYAHGMLQRVRKARHTFAW